ncbi:glycoside hydrolase family 2 TIM barrel-domain containing protein [Algoriphagus namhaensis]|uniref:Glycoside hydrolase family 2 TIM barrel-domain containing protein n=1 Tax=Algoriphagus namhaensis TaxID=915353 RepID=A0ABV8AS83_9BACT
MKDNPLRQSRFISFCIFLLNSSIWLFGACESPVSRETIRIEGRQILLNDNPFVVKGICYNPVPKGSNDRVFDQLDQDLALMKEAGINTIRVYSPIQEQWVLDEFAKQNLKVIIGFGYNQEGVYDILSGSFIDYIEMYRDHPAILMWELGNEYNYHPQWFDGDMKNWYRAMNDAAGLIHEKDPSRPVTTAHGELPDSLALSMSPNIDVWGMNVYRWDDPTDIFQEWKEISDKPMYLSEAGGDSYMTISKLGYEAGPNQKAQADATKNILESVFNHRDICFGVTLFAFNDELWKAGNPDTLDPGGWAPNSSGVPYDGSPNEEYWGIVDIDRNKKEAFQVVKEIYSKN